MSESLSAALIPSAEVIIRVPYSLTATNLLEICTLPRLSSQAERNQKLQTLVHWNESNPSLLSKLLLTTDGVDTNSGCYALHWASGTAFDEAVQFILGQQNDDVNVNTTRVNQRAHFPSTGRTPLHYAARNGHLSTCKLLIEGYGAHPNPKCSRGAVNPLQLATWQNWLHVVQYLVEVNNSGPHNVVLEKNDFQCGLMHWVGLIPEKRWHPLKQGNIHHTNDTNHDDDAQHKDGSGVLPLVTYLFEMGVSYESTPANSNSQGHTPLHKAAYRGNGALLKYFWSVHGVYDNVQDKCGNFAADLARMQGHHEVHQWLLYHCSTERLDSLTILGLFSSQTNGTATTPTATHIIYTPEEIKRRYTELARIHHPDKQQQQQLQMQSNSPDKLNVTSVDTFLEIQNAYEHLIQRGGMGSQKNPKHDELKLLTTTRETKRSGNANANDNDNDDHLFNARILAVISDYREKGFPISNISKRWNQIWPDRPFPSPDEYIIEIEAVTGNDATTQIIKKRVKLLRFLKYKCTHGVKFKKTNGVMLAYKI
eukprot:scaffold16915_cov42-Attheya_sp.AAC.3